MANRYSDIHNFYRTELHRRRAARSRRATMVDARIASSHPAGEVGGANELGSRRGSSHSHAVAKSLGCPGVDIEEWRKANKIRLTPQFVNRWYLAIRTTEEMSGANVYDMILDACSHWFRGDIGDRVSDLFMASYYEEGEQIGYIRGVADHIRVKGYGSTRNDVMNVAQTYERDIVEPPLPALKSGNIKYCVLEFAYRGSFDELPWPTYAVTEEGLLTSWTEDVNCPTRADVMVLASSIPEEVAPPPVSMADLVEAEARQALRNTEAALDYTRDQGKKYLMPWLTPVLVGAGVGGAAYIAWRMGLFSGRPKRGT